MMPRLARALVNISLIRPGEKLLDPFSGTGGIVLEASLVGAYGIGSDIDPFMADGSRKNVPGAGIVRADTRCLPFRDASIDAVVTISRTDSRSRLLQGAWKGCIVPPCPKSGVFSYLGRGQWWSPTGIYQVRLHR